MGCGDLELIERRGLRPLGLFTMMRFRKLGEGRAAA
jgi:phosphatidylethanolamine/phosphatidyl-N-methylethanolamine N-methyltransferase